MLLGHSLIMQQIRDFRIVGIEGRYGSYKTALAFRLAYELVKTGEFRHVVANLPNAFQSDFKDIHLRDNELGDPTFLDTVFILDEGGIFLDSDKEIKKFVAFLRKLNCILIIPSVMPLPSTAKTLVIARKNDFQKIGLPWLRYRAYLSSGRTKEDYTFSWLFPSEIYGIYNTYATPADADDIAKFIFEQSAIVSKAQGYTRTYADAYNKTDNKTRNSNKQQTPKITIKTTGAKRKTSQDDRSGTLDLSE